MILGVFFLVLFEGILALKEGDVCISEDGLKGLCVSVEGCCLAKNNIFNDQYFDICGDAYGKPLICCTITGIRSLMKCAEYHSFPYDQIDDEPYVGIIGGEKAVPGEFPHMAALGYEDRGNIIFNCGGSLISEQYVLTAAHCLFSSRRGRVTVVRLGVTDLGNRDNRGEVQEYDAKEIFFHPSYKGPVRYNDIGLIKLDRPAKFNQYVRPACLDLRENLNNTIPIATGWGVTKYMGEPSPTLNKVKLDHFSIDDCKRFFFTPNKFLPYGVLGGMQLCVGSRGDSRDTCHGDSGGPLQVYNQQLKSTPFNVIGITSFGQGCGIPDTPALYTRVAFYIKWIEDTVWPI